ncbi:MAG: hypothetical protein AAFY29_23355 [Pseudomonadota bacterium]
MRIFRAASMSGVALVFIFFALVFAGDPSSVEFSIDFFAGIALIAPFLWVLGAGFAAVLLIPLIPLADRTSPAFSFMIFTIIGFVVPAYFSYEMLFLGVHGNPPDIDTKSGPELVILIVSGGSLGAASAVLAWCSVQKSKVCNAT